ncbi:ExeA family protein [Alloyangia pacifica]|uniref:ExeA family protein n=1 Tax=Alloyangia pacifica TaxID=311180 RepID=UPI0020C82BA5|nr:AAA family ATPase [Alloyangia pacifica]
MTFDIQIYAAHFGLSKRPFTLVPDPELIFWSRGHRRAAAVLDYGLMNRAPITLVTGEIGSGKTTLLRHLLDGIGDELRVAFVSNAMPGGRADLLRWVLHALGEPHDKASSYIELYQRFESLLVEEYANGRRVVVIFDEAQNLGASGLEHLRLLTNIKLRRA